MIQQITQFLETNFIINSNFVMLGTSDSRHLKSQLIFKQQKGKLNWAFIRIKTIVKIVK